MTVRNQELYNIIETLPEELSEKVMEYIEYLKYQEIINKAPENIIIKSKVDLRKKLEEGIKDTDSGNVCFLDEAFSEIENILVE